VPIITFVDKLDRELWPRPVRLLYAMSTILELSYSHGMFPGHGEF
jgi:hypothetical protein